MTIGAFELERPLALLLLALPIALLLLVRLRAKPEEDATGTLEIWRRAVAEQPTSAARSRRKIPLAIWLLCASLACGAIAVAGPRREQAETNMLLVVVDRSPSMYLVERGRSRLDRALSLASKWIEGRPAGSVRWICPPTEPVPWNAGGEFKPFMSSSDPLVRADIPESWRRAPRDPRAEPDFASYDRPGCLWITDRAPDAAPRHAGVACSGGSAVPGPVGVHERNLLEWDGARLVDVGRKAPERTVVVRKYLPPAVERVARAWAEARGLTVSIDDVDEAALLVSGRFSEDETSREVVVGRDGWTARAIVGNAAPPRGVVEFSPPLLMSVQTWLSDEAGEHAWVRNHPGVISLDFTALEVTQGDPAAFAVSWARLFDENVLQPDGCISLAERQAAGEPVERAPVAAVDRRSTSSRLPASLGWVALALALVALAVIPVSGRRTGSYSQAEPVA